ncbi:MAG: aldehyde dehydrogenase [Microbacteriaceae bacterium]|jgi:aldehyde dehydrogenase (NAD+)|nr:Betaine-aldehyde dehydrogenase [Microbacteriaceae bacterium]MDQ1549272.1 aldehyde dehydrogenase [Microbacteriaceae bacterium]MDQ1554259.1 aldehyde dehydrogenase [Microbacteriaceae bacterium]
MNQLGAIINGKHVQTEGSVGVIDPSSGELFAETADCGVAEIDLAVAAAREAGSSWRRVPVADRARILRKISVLVERDRELLADLESKQTGKPMKQARRDVEITVRYFDFYASVVETFYGTTIPLNDDTLIFTRWEPHGVTAHVVPWNYPLQILARSIAPSLAMGNGCVLKPSEETPLTALHLAELALEAGLPAGLFNVVPGFGETAGIALTNHAGIDHISFTGSVEVGKIISRAAAEHTIPVTMELGGKSPNIVFADADLDKAVPVLVNAILQNAGQTCSAGSRLLVEESIHEELVDRLAEAFEKVDIGPASTDPTLGPLISEQQRERVLGYVAWAKEHASVRFGGEALNGGELGNGYYIQPTLIDNVDPTSRLAQEEIFGPVLVVTPFKDADEAVALANGTDYGLVAGVWTTNVSTAHRMIRDVVSGQVFVNTYGASGGVELPFGGFKRSGHGREKGAEGLRGFGQIKTAVVAL